MWKTPLAAAMLVLGAGLLGLATAPWADEDRGGALALSCFGCHGPEGRSTGSIPAIADKSAAFIGDSLRDFRSGKRAATIMDRIARGYSDAEIDALARHLGKRE